jgi:hypothetical protein
MANRARPTLQKRERERARQQKQKNKEARREEAKTRRANTPSGPGGDEDPDLAGIRPGPQPLADWQKEVLEVEPEPES